MNCVSPRLKPVRTVFSGPTVLTRHRVPSTPRLRDLDGTILINPRITDKINCIATARDLISSG
jgi:hypothetical protein